jgi:hypothetical protein
MALIEIYHVVASYYPMHDNDVVEGMLARLVTVADQPEATFAIGDSATTHRTIGVFGDTRSSTAAGTPFAANVIVNGRGDTRSTQNRVSDMFNETLASGQATVYHSGGEFWTDQFVTTDNFFIGGPLYTNAAGLFTITASTENRVVGTLITPPGAYPSGVPGTDVQGSMSLGTYIRFKLEI